jgi:hypothetical protein
MLKKPVSVVLASLRVSPYGPGKSCLAARGRAGEKGYGPFARYGLSADKARPGAPGLDG